jgi:hypothetical protein
VGELPPPVAVPLNTTLSEAQIDVVLEEILNVGVILLNTSAITTLLVSELVV